MGFGIFIHRSDSIYDDSPSERYQFPRQYLSRVEACIGDWIIYYEPQKVTRTRGYFAVAKVERVISDPKASDMYLALIEPGSYLDFANPVPFSSPDGRVELGILNAKGQVSARARWAVRPLSVSDFNRIVALGLNEEEPLLPRLDETAPTVGVREDQAPFNFEQTRDRVSYLSSRLVRDQVFRRRVLSV